MGCISSKGSALSSDERKIFHSEEILGLNILKSKKIIEVIHKHSNPCQMSQINLERILSDLNVDFKGCRKFYEKFLHNGCYSIKKICCVAVLFGYSSQKSKVKLLFYNYAVNDIDFLYKSDLEVMLSHIIFIFLIALPSFSLYFHRDDGKFSQYCSILSLFVNKLLKFFIELIMADKTEISFYEFNNSFLDEKTQLWLDGKKMREHCLLVYRNSGYFNANIREAFNEINSNEEIKETVTEISNSVPYKSNLNIS